MRNRMLLDFFVGCFVIIAALAVFVLGFKVSNFGGLYRGSVYEISADFDNIGSLKRDAPVMLSGVKIGLVTAITLDPATFQATVSMQIESSVNKLPQDTSANILTQGILGANYVGLTPGFSTQNLSNGSKIVDTHSALILENVIGQLLFGLKGDKGKK